MLVDCHREQPDRGEFDRHTVNSVAFGTVCDRKLTQFSGDSRKNIVPPAKLGLAK